MARQIVEDCRSRGGHLTVDDLADYEVIKRAPLIRDHGGHRLATNPGPSSGGMLIAFTLALLDGIAAGTYGGPDHLNLLARAMAATSRARIEARLDHDGAADRLLDDGLLDVLGDVDHDGSGTPGLGQVEGLLHDVREILGLKHEEAVLDDG